MINSPFTLETPSRNSPYFSVEVLCSDLFTSCIESLSTRLLIPTANIRQSGLRPFLPSLFFQTGNRETNEGFDPPSSQPPLPPVPVEGRGDPLYQEPWFHGKISRYFVSIFLITGCGCGVVGFADF